MKRPSIIAAGGLGLLVLGFIFWSMYEAKPDEHEVVEIPSGELKFDMTPAPDSGSVEETEQDSIWTMDSANARILKFEGVEGSLDVRIGGPGLDAAFEATVMGGLMPIPLRYEGDEVPSMEVRATSAEGCFWGDVSGDQEQVSLVPGTRLRVRLVDPLGRPVSGARVRVGREFLSFLFENGDSSELGVFEAECMPPGEYAVSVSAPGFVTEHVRTAVPGELELVLTRGYRLEGQVRNEQGEAVQHAMLLISTCSEDGCVPESIGASSVDGKFSADNLRTSSIQVQVRHPDYETNEARVLVGSPTQIVLKKATSRKFLVVDAQARPVSNATIEWESAVDRGRGLSDSKGEWKDLGAPVGARARASFGRFVSPWVEVQGLEVRLNVESQKARSILLRIEAPEEVQDIRVTLLESSVNCPAERLNPSDFRLQCDEGAARLNIDMGRGTYTTVIDLKSGTSVNVPSAQKHALWVESPETPIAEVEYGHGWQPLVLNRSRDGEWKATFSFWGESQVRIRAARMGETVMSVKGSETRVELKAVQAHRLWVLDAQGSPVTGAWIGIVDSSGIRQKWATSSGQLPFERRIREGENLSLFVVDPRRGAGVVLLGREREERIELRRPVFESPPAPYLGLDAAQTLIGASMLRDGQSYRIDEMNAEAQKAGVPRGAWWVAGWKESAGTRVILWNGKNYTEHIIKAN